MSFELHEYTFEDLKAPTKGAFAMGPFGSRIKAENFVNEGVPVIKGGNLNGNLNESSFDFLTHEKAAELSSSIARRLDLVITHRGTLGQVGIIPKDSRYPEYIVSQSQLKLSFDHTKVNPYFIYYYLRSPLGQKRLLANTSQVGVPAIAQALTSIRNIKISLPSLQEQNKVVNTLKLIDDRIGLLRQTNITFEAIAQALFKSWFVDFDPVCAKAEGREPQGIDAETAALFPDSFEVSALGLVPKGWQIKSLDSIAEYLNGLALQKYPPEGGNSLPVIKIAQLRNSETNGADRTSCKLKSEYIIQNGDVLFSWSGSLMVKIWCGGEGALNQHLFKVISKNYPKWFYYHWTNHHLPQFQQIAANKATTMGHIQRRHLTEAKVIVPSPALIQMANDFFEPLLSRTINNSISIQTLTALRDTLLPWLIAGELRISESEKIASLS